MLAARGFAATMGNLYAAHVLGAGGAVLVLGAAGNTMVADILSEGVIVANPVLADMTVADFRAWAASKGGGDAVGYSFRGTRADLIEMTDDPDMLEAALEGFDMIIDAQAKDQKEEQEQNLAAGYDMIDKGMTYDDVLTAMGNVFTPAMKTKLLTHESMLKKSRAVETDQEFMTGLPDMTDEQLAAEDMNNWLGQLSHADLKIMANKRNEARKRQQKAAQEQQTAGPDGNK